ncbi:uncharacterized protein [Argopecten irradians]|uniref:uncharacterized protein n=1 Tax=Argopecten irradians TaxID=31199 RepID=UPI003716F450
MDGDWQSNDGDEGFDDGDEAEEENVPMDINLATEGEDELLNGPRASVFYMVPQSDDKGKDFTKSEVEEMMKSEEYQKKIDTCHLCGQCWYEGKYSKDCPECDGHHMTRPCAVCGGECNQVWKRDVKISHSIHKAHWDGKCILPIETQNAYRKRNTTSKSLTEGMQDLSTR